jgi:hypothetical protein
MRSNLGRGKVPAVSVDPAEVVYRKSARCLRLQREALAKQRDLFDGRPQPDSPAASDRDALSGRSKQLKARRWILNETIRQAERITDSAVDHMLGLQKCVESTPEARFCTMTIGRGMMDAATRVCYLLDPVIPLETRLVRGAALLLDSSEEELTAVRALPPLEPRCLKRCKSSRPSATTCRGGSPSPGWKYGADRNADPTASRGTLHRNRYR